MWQIYASTPEKRNSLVRAKINYLFRYLDMPSDSLDEHKKNSLIQDSLELWKYCKNLDNEVTAKNRMDSRDVWYKLLNKYGKEIGIG